MMGHSVRVDGFTLMEVLIALVIGAIIIGAGSQLFATLIDARIALQSRVTYTTTSNLAVTEIERALRSARPSVTTPFIGDAGRISFESWCPDSYGGRTRCAVQVDARPTLAIIEQHSSRKTETWVGDSRAGRFDYVIDPLNNRPVLDAWKSTAASPLAVRWISEATTNLKPDTLIFAILWGDP
jgi:prepilin-type N-terminal cleavage/methylation domain-containing protein